MIYVISTGALIEATTKHEQIVYQRNDFQSVLLSNRKTIKRVKMIVQECKAY